MTEVYRVWMTNELSRRQSACIQQFIADVYRDGFEEGVDKMCDAVFQELGGDVDQEFLEGIAAELKKKK